MKRLFVLSLVISLLGCNLPDEPVIDTSSDQAFQVSVAQVRDSLDGQQRAELAEALLVLGHAPPDARHPETDPDQRFLQRVSGKTAQQIVAEARAVGEAD